MNHSKDAQFERCFHCFFLLSVPLPPDAALAQRAARLALEPGGDAGAVETVAARQSDEWLGGPVVAAANLLTLKAYAAFTTMSSCCYGAYSQLQFVSAGSTQMEFLPTLKFEI